MGKHSNAITTDAYVSPLFSLRVTEQFSRQYYTYTEARIRDLSELPTYIKKEERVMH
jgi:hypothetical protein